MIRRLLERFRLDRGLHRATVRIDFSSQTQVTPKIYWFGSRDLENDTIALLVFIYARILYELAELNELRTARELIRFLDQVCGKILNPDGPPRRVRLPLGQLNLSKEAGEQVEKSYQAEFFQLQGGAYRLEFQGSLGKEGFYLPGAFLALLQTCMDDLRDEALHQLVRDLERLHTYYRYRRDFWDGGALMSGPSYALSQEELRPEEVTPEI